MYSAEAIDNRIPYLVKEDYQDYFEEARIGIIYLDGYTRIKNINREVEKICGIERTEVLGKMAHTVFSSYGENFLKIFAMSEYDNYYKGNVNFKVKGQMVSVHVEALKLPEALDRHNSLIVIMQDISAVRATIKQIQTTKMLMSLGELAAGVAHHVRTPLTTISGYLQVMLNRLEDDEYKVRRDVLESLLDEVSYINNVVKELILFAKPPVEKEPGVDINRVLEEALLLAFKDLGSEKVGIDKQLANNLQTINADRNLLKQALLNIMQNALEAMTDDGILTVKTWLHSDSNMLVIEIADTGDGVSPQILSRVFEPFYTTKLDRMGIGLPIAHRIITEHGGFININAEDNQGTKVRVYLPIMDERVRQLTLVHQQVLNLQ